MIAETQSRPAGSGPVRQDPGATTSRLQMKVPVMTPRGIFLTIVAALGVCLASVAAAQPPATEFNMIQPDRDFWRVWRAYPDMDAHFARDGTPRSLAQVRRVARGQTKGQLVRLLGNPVAASADGGWDFNIKLPLPQRNRLVCQYRVYFDSHERVRGTVWRRPQCADLITGAIR